VGEEIRMSTDARTIWKRRAILMALVGLVVAIPVTLLVRSGDDDDSGGPSGIGEPALQAAKRDSAVGITYRVPKGWKSEKKASVIRLKSRDRAAGLTLSAPGPASDAGQILRETVDVVRKSYDDVKEGARQGETRVGGRPAEAVAFTAKNEKGTALRILISVARGKEKAYLIQYFMAGSAGDEAFAAAQAALQALKLQN